MAKAKVSALKYPAYAKFVDARDRAAEKILGNFRIEQSDILRKYFKMILDAAAKFLLHAHNDARLFDTQVHSILTPAIKELTDLTQDLRQITFILSLVSEAEAIGRIKGKAKYDAGKSLVSDHLARPSMGGGQVRDRIALYLDRLRRDVVDALQIGLVKKDTPQDIFKRIVKAFPSVRRQRVVRELSKIKESKKDDPSNMNAGDVPDVPDELDDPKEIATGFVSDGEWDAIVDAYKTAYIPETRGPEYQIDPDEPGWPTDEKVYATDIEREMTEDFVKSVRDGQVEAANQNGIDDFMWIAILDDKTCEDCCAPRDGMTSSEIEKALEDGSLDGDCDAITPSAHINCRCRLAPMVDSDEEPVEVDTEGFNDWAEN